MKKRLKFDLCRFRTDRFRAMDQRQAANAYFRLAEPYIVHLEKRPTERSARGLAVAFLDALSRPSKAKEADRLERKIWALQTKRGCRISPQEQVARDATYAGSPQEIIDRLRGRRRPKIR